MSQVIVIAGPTGVGESTVTKKLIERHSNFVRLVTATTRPPRLGEKEGVDYYFFSKEKFQDELKKGNILEYTYIENRDVYYGSYKPDLEAKLKKGLTVIVNPDIVGARYYKENFAALTIFLLPESLDILKKRIQRRQPSISGEELKKRLKNAEKEIREEGPFYEYKIYNREGEIEKTIEEIEKIINQRKKAERSEEKE